MNRVYRVKTPMVPILVLLSFSLGLAMVGCNSGSTATNTTSTGQPSVSYSADIQPIFNDNCIVCHQYIGQAGLALEPNKSYGELVGIQSTQASGKLRVKAGEPDQSYLINKLEGTQVQAGGLGVRMPQGQPALSATQINLIRTWIQEGAKNN